MDKKTILIIDDDRRIRDVLKSYLLSGYDVLTVDDDVDTIESMLTGWEIDVVLLDYVLPRVGFDTVCGLIERVSPSTSVVVMSGYDDVVIPDGYGFVAKPFDIKGLASELERIIEKI